MSSSYYRFSFDSDSLGGTEADWPARTTVPAGKSTVVKGQIAIAVDDNGGVTINDTAIDCRPSPAINTIGKDENGDLVVTVDAGPDELLW